MRLSDFISRVDKDTILNIELLNGDLVYYGRASNYLFDPKDNGYFVDYFYISYLVTNYIILEVRVVC